MKFIEPMIPTLVDKPPDAGEWLTEVKFDGWRCQIHIENGKVRVFTRRGHDWTDKLKPIADAAAKLDASAAIIDGELVHPHESGRSDFAALQSSVRSATGELIFMAFDLLHFAAGRSSQPPDRGPPSSVAEPHPSKWEDPILRSPDRFA